MEREGRICMVTNLKLRSQYITDEGGVFLQRMEFSRL